MLLLQTKKPFHEQVLAGQSYFKLSDFGILLVVMATVTVVPGISRPIYIWMTAEKENEENQKALRNKRTSMILMISVIIIVFTAIHAGINFFNNNI